jgi:hypothetical protein
MAWLGIWFEHGAGEGGPRRPELLNVLARPVIYPFAHTFIEEEAARLAKARDPGEIRRDGETFRAYYSIAHDGEGGSLERQGCRILRWLFENFLPSGPRPSLASRFCEIPIVIHADDPSRAAALANALAILRFLGAGEDQAIAKIMIHPWNPFRGSPSMAAAEYEKRVLEFLHGEIFYPEDVSLFDILGRNDLKSHREMEACCLTQIGFIAPLLEWADECWPQSAGEAADLAGKLKRSLEDEVRHLKRAASPQRAVRRFGEGPGPFGEEPGKMRKP